MKHRDGAIYRSLAQHVGIIVTLFLGFMMRGFLAPWRSYWYDEFLSVYRDGANQDSALAVVQTLANSIHPPLYQVILYNWIELFGESELATRSLSNLYVVGATLCLYLLAYNVYGRRVALGSALVFTLMYFPMRYGMEARSYAQTLFLTCLSSWLFFLYITKLPKPCRWKELILNWRFAWLMLANTGLLMTHFYNIFFLGAQGLFLFIYFLTRGVRLSWYIETLKVAAISGTPVALLLLSWGWVMARAYSKIESRGAYHADFPSADPWTMFSDNVLEPTFEGASFAQSVPLVAALVLLLLISQVAWAFYQRRGGEVSDRAHFTLYFVIWAFVPCVMAFLLFLVAETERYNPRYFIFCAPPLAIIILLFLEDLVRFANLVSVPFKSVQPAQHYVRYALIYAIVAAVVIAAPGGRRAASLVKEDYRGIARMMADVVLGDPDHSYILYEASRRKDLDVYLVPMTKGQLRIANRMSPEDEKLERFEFEKHADEIDNHDFLIVAFTHKRFERFPLSTERLADLYDLHARIIDRNGRGIMVYKTKKSSEGSR